MNLFTFNPYSMLMAIQPKLERKIKQKREQSPFLQVDKYGVIRDDTYAKHKPKHVPTFTGEYSYSRSAGKVRKVADLLTQILEQLKVEKPYSYDTALFTLTFPEYYDNDKRMQQRNKFLKQLRKRSKYYLMTTEIHKSGLFHFHIVTILDAKQKQFFTEKRKSKIIEWSFRYCGSINGLDVKFGRPFHYVVKYVSKDLDVKIKSSSQLWSYKGLKKFEIDKKDIKYMQPYQKLGGRNINLAKAGYIMMSETLAQKYNAKNKILLRGLGKKVGEKMRTRLKNELEFRKYIAEKEKRMLEARLKYAESENEVNYLLEVYAFRLEQEKKIKKMLDNW